MEEKKIQCRVVIFLAKLLKKDDEKFEKEEKLCPALKKKTTNTKIIINLIIFSNSLFPQ